MGVASALASNPAFMRRVSRVLGTSGGACAGAMLLASPEALEPALEYYCDGRAMRGARLHDYVNPHLRLLHRSVEELGLLPPGSAKRLSGRFSAMVTPCRLPLRNVAIDAWDGEGALLAAISASCCVSPVGVAVPDAGLGGCVDGGLSDSLPLCNEPGIAATLTIAPLAGHGIDIFPSRPFPREERIPRADLRMWLRYELSVANARALKDASLPPSPTVARERFAEGRADGEGFLRAFDEGRVLF